MRSPEASNPASGLPATSEAPSERAAKTRTCRAHCTACDSHFAGNGAFDAHRIGRFDVPRDDPNYRRCGDPDTMTDKRGERIFRERKGECRIVSGEPRVGIVIYGLDRDFPGIKED